MTHEQAETLYHRAVTAKLYPTTVDQKLDRETVETIRLACLARNWLVAAKVLRSADWTDPEWCARRLLKVWKDMRKEAKRQNAEAQ